MPLDPMTKTETISDLLAFIYAVAAISGAAGGCLVAAHHVLRGRNLTFLFLTAYAFVGMIFGITGAILVTLLTDVALTPERMFIFGLIFGIVGSTALAGANLSARFMLKRLGVEVEVSVKRSEGGKDGN